MMRDRLLKSSRFGLLSTALGAVFAVATSVTTASATIVTYSGASAWAAAVSSPSTVDFNGATGGQSWYEGTNFASGGVNFSSGYITNQGPSFASLAAGTFYGSGYLEWETNPPDSNTLTVTLPGAVDAIGFDYAEINGATDTFTIVADSQTFTATTSVSGALFFGLTDTNAFTSFTITDLEDVGGGFFSLYPTIDNLSYASSLSSPATVPEPASLAVLLSGLFGLRLIRRQRG
jgi:hypothetical protein